MLGTNATVFGAGLPGATSLPYRQQVERTTVGSVNNRTAALDPETLEYSLSDLQFRIVRYLMPREFHAS